MKQDDYFLNQIDILGRILGKIVADLLQLNSPDNVLEIEAIKEEFQNGLNLDLNELQFVSDEDFLETLLKNPKINLDNLEKLAESFQLISIKSDINLNSKALSILKYIESVSNTYSAERLAKIKRLETI